MIRNMFTLKNIGIGVAFFLIGVLFVLLTPVRHFPLITPTIDDVDPVEFYEAFSQNPDDFVFIDVRGENSYNRVHATDSISMPLHTLYDEWRNLPRNTDKTIVLICSGALASGVGYHYLEHQGFYNIQRIEGGIENWQLSGLPVETQL